MAASEGSEFLIARYNKLKAIPSDERPYDVKGFVESWQLLEEVVHAFPYPEVGNPPAPLPPQVVTTSLTKLMAAFCLAVGGPLYPADWVLPVMFQLRPYLEARQDPDPSNRPGGSMVELIPSPPLHPLLDPTANWPDHTLPTTLRVLCSALILMKHARPDYVYLAQVLLQSAAATLAKPEVAASLQRELDEMQIESPPEGSSSENASASGSGSGSSQGDSQLARQAQQPRHEKKEQDEQQQPQQEQQAQQEEQAQQAQQDGMLTVQKLEYLALYYAYQAMEKCIDGFMEGGAHQMVGPLLQQELQVAKRMVEVQPDHPDGHCYLGKTLGELGNHTASIASWRRAVAAAEELGSDYLTAQAAFQSAASRITSAGSCQMGGLPQPRGTAREDIEAVMQVGEAALGRAKRLLPQLLVGNLKAYRQQASMMASEHFGGGASQPNPQGASEVAFQPKEYHCSQCGKLSVEVKACGGCRKAHYCSKECQATHWCTHKAECKAAQKAKK